MFLKNFNDLIIYKICILKNCIVFQAEQDGSWARSSRDTSPLTHQVAQLCKYQSPSTKCKEIKQETILPAFRRTRWKKHIKEDRKESVTLITPSKQVSMDRDASWLGEGNTEAQALDLKSPDQPGWNPVPDKDLWQPHPLTTRLMHLDKVIWTARPSRLLTPGPLPGLPARAGIGTPCSGQECYRVVSLEMAQQSKVFQDLLASNKELDKPKNGVKRLLEKCKINGYGRNQLCRDNLGSTKRKRG